MGKIQHYINGKWMEGTDQGIPVLDAVTGELIAHSAVEGLDIGLYVQSTIEMMASFDLPILGYLYNQNTDGFPDCGDNWTKKTVEGDL